MDLTCARSLPARELRAKVGDVVDSARVGRAPEGHRSAARKWKTAVVLHGVLIVSCCAQEIVARASPHGGGTRWGIGCVCFLGSEGTEGLAQGALACQAPTVPLGGSRRRQPNLTRGLALQLSSLESSSRRIEKVRWFLLHVLHARVFCMARCPSRPFPPAVGGTVFASGSRTRCHASCPPGIAATKPGKGDAGADKTVRAKKQSGRNLSCVCTSALENVLAFFFGRHHPVVRVHCHLPGIREAGLDGMRFLSPEAGCA